MLTDEIVEFTFCANHTFERAKAQQMCLTYIGDDTEVRSYNIHECLDFAWMIGTHLHHCHLMLRSELEQRFWHTDVVVEIALCVENLIFFLQHGSNQFLRGGLAIRTRHTNDGRAEFFPMESG